jgi:chemotaxis protein MotB
MNRKRQFNHRVSHERWLVSYADFITLMFAFFVVMFSSARIDKQRSAQLTEAIQSAFQELGANAPAKPHSTAQSRADALARTSPQPTGFNDVNHKPEDFAAIQKELEKLLSPEIQRREVALRIEPDGLIISLREIGFFDSGSAQIKAQARDAVHRVAVFLEARNCSLRIEGHTDNVPIHTASFASNWELSTARATGLVRLLVENEGFAPERLSAAGYGEFHPVADNSSAAGQQLNRRVDIVVVPEVIAANQVASAAAAHSPPALKR